MCSTTTVSMELGTYSAAMSEATCSTPIDGLMGNMDSELATNNGREMGPASVA